MKKTINLLLVLTLFAIILSACSNENNTESTSVNASNDIQQQANNNNSQMDQDTSQTEGEDAANVTGTWPRKIIDGTGKEIELTSQPERIVVLHPLYLDYFFALDTPPVASGSASSALAEYVTLEPYSDTAEVTDLGSGREINIEKVASMNPDVIVTFVGHIDSIYDDLVKVAPVVQINYTDTWDQTTLLIGEMLGKEQLANELVSETKQKIDQTRSDLVSLKDKTFALLRVTNKGTFNAQGTKNTMYYNEESGFGLSAPEGYPEDAAPLSLESLSEMDPDYIIIQHDLETAQSAIQQNESLAVWQSLTAVKEDHVLLFDNSLNTASILAVRIAADLFLELASQP